MEWFLNLWYGLGSPITLRIKGNILILPSIALLCLCTLVSVVLFTLVVHRCRNGDAWKSYMIIRRVQRITQFIWTGVFFIYGLSYFNIADVTSNVALAFLWVITGICLYLELRYRDDFFKKYVTPLISRQIPKLQC